jgi:hypothetical protein
MDAERGRGAGWREAAVACALALLVAAWPLRAGLVPAFGGGETVLFGVDVATAQLPWSAHVPGPGAEGAVERPRNPALSDQALCFYPFYRWVSRSWRGGDAPTWCPLIYAGAPGIANPQSGALDPQVLFVVLLEALFGEDWFVRGLAIVAWLRLAAAGLGAYLLARCLALARAPAALVGVAFGLSGYVVLWLNFSLGHVTPLLPWVLLGLEGVRGTRPRLAAAGAALAMALAILGGHPETAFYVGLAAGFWAFAIGRRDRRAGGLALAALALGSLMAAASLMPFAEYLALSGAHAVREREAARVAIDLVALGALAAALALALRFRSLFRDSTEQPRSEWLPGALGVALGVGGAALLLVGRGLPEPAALALVPDRLGAPGDGAGGYRGAGTFVEAASGWVAFPALAFALASWLAPNGRMRRRGLVAGLGLFALLLTIEVPGLLDVVRYVPLVGLGATVRLGAVASLMLALLAGDALQSAPRACRYAAAMALVPLALLALGTRQPEPVAEGVPTTPETDELFGLALAPGGELDGVRAEVEGWLHPELAVDRARVRVETITSDGTALASQPLDAPLVFRDGPSELVRREAPAAVDAAPPGARWFHAPYLVLGFLEAGHQRFTIDFFAAGVDEPVASRLAGVATIRRGANRSAVTLAMIGLGLALLCLPRVTSGRGAWFVPALALVHGLAFARGQNPAVPTSELFPATRTEALLAEQLGDARFFGDPHVLPPSTGLVRGLRALDGYDGMDVGTFNAYKYLVLRPGPNPLLAWNARGVDLESGAFRLFGVGMLALRDPLSAADARAFELVAGPGTPDAAECFVYRARDPLPRAFCVNRIVTPEELRALIDRDPRGFDPLAVACTRTDWRPEHPFTSATVSDVAWTNATVTLTAELDGDGLLVVTDQHFPGWRAYVDGEPAELLEANAIFRGVPLGAGRHTVELRFESTTLRAGTWLSGFAAVAVLLLAALGLRQGR